jgi:hypothetical protein
MASSERSTILSASPTLARRRRQSESDDDDDDEDDEDDDDDEPAAEIPAQAAAAASEDGDESAKPLKLHDTLLYANVRIVAMMTRISCQQARDRGSVRNSNGRVFRNKMMSAKFECVESGIGIVVGGLSRLGSLAWGRSLASRHIAGTALERRSAPLPASAG